MHIAILCDNLPPHSPGGAGKIAWQLGLGLIASGHRVTFITSTPGETRLERRQGIPVYALHSKYPERWMGWFGLFNPQTVIPLNRLLRRLKPDIVHAHTVNVHLGYHSLVIGRIGAKAATVYTAHDVMPFSYTKLTHYIDPKRPDQCSDWNYRLPPLHNIRRMRFRWNPARNLSIRHTLTYYTDVRVAVSHALKTALEANHLPPFEVVHNGVPLAEFDVPQAGIDVLRHRLGLNGRPVILFGGRMSRHKGDRQLLSALRQVKTQVPDVALLILSRPSDYIECLMQEYPDLAENVVVGGWMEGAELSSAFHMADVIVSPSICFDSLVMVNLEGMAARKPAVSTCFGGAPEAVIDGETGYIVNPYNIDALADRLTRLLRDPALRERMGAAGRAHVEEAFSLEVQVNRMLDVYQRALEKRHKTR